MFVFIYFKKKVMSNAVIRFHFRAMFFIATIFGEHEEVEKR